MGAYESARDELYGLDPDAFMARREELAESARAEGDVAAAKAIGALRKPTRSAYALNLLVRVEPDTADRLDEIGADLRAAQQRLDGAAMREVSTRRNKLIDDLARAALKAAGRGAAASMRDEIAGTLGAAIADPDVLGRLRTGALVRAERWDGLGLPDGPVLRLVPPPKEDAEPAEQPRSTAADRARERQETKVREAEQALAEAEQQLDEASNSVADQRRAVRRLEDQLADARRRLDDAELEVRRARTHIDQTRAALDRTRR